MERGIMSGNRLKAIAMAAMMVEHVISAFFIKMKHFYKETV